MAAIPYLIGGSSFNGLSSLLYLLVSKSKTTWAFTSNSTSCWGMSSSALSINLVFASCYCSWHSQIVTSSPFSCIIVEHIYSLSAHSSSSLQVHISYSWPSSSTSISHIKFSGLHSSSSSGQKQTWISWPSLLNFSSHIFTSSSHVLSGHMQVSCSSSPLIKQIYSSPEHSAYSISGQLHISYSYPSMISIEQIRSDSSHVGHEQVSISEPSTISIVHTFCSGLQSSSSSSSPKDQH